MTGESMSMERLLRGDRISNPRCEQSIKDLRAKGFDDRVPDTG